MPTTRRSAAGAARGRAAPTKGQSTISFANKVTKAVPQDVKSNLVKPVTAKIEIAQRTKPLEKKAADVVGETPIDHQEADVEEEEEEEEVATEAVVAKKSEAELKAERITDSQVSKYWKGIENERKAPRVHQQGLSVNDKVLRYFDVSSQYGPCIGIDRMKRWQRADRLGLNPPIEVLAVLLKEEQKSHKEAETAQMDHILNSIAVGT